MKIKNLLVLGIASSAMFIFSGCSGKSGALVANEKSCQIWYNPRIDLNDLYGF